MWNKFKCLFKNIDIMPKFDKDVFECLIDKVIIGETLEDGTINPYTIRLICKNGTEINCKDKFTAMSDKQHSNNTATKEKQHIMSVAFLCIKKVRKVLSIELKFYKNFFNLLILFS